RLGAAIETLNARAAQVRALHVESAALSDRFALDAATLPMPQEPEAEIDVTLPSFWQRRPLRPAMEWDEHNLRERRTYQECDPTSEGYRIITRAGLQPWPALTEEQAAAVAERAQDKVEERRSTAAFAAEAARIVAEGALLGGKARLGNVPPPATT